ncbi:MAG TPA: glycosyltransferase family 4 protein [Vicinamibacterales bacterium]
MKIACVVHRYGPDIAGGSEAHCRGIAERLAATHEVTVLTSCARDYLTWADSYPEGRSDLNGVTVIRFPVERTRNLHAFTDLSHEVFDRPTPRERQEAWFRENGPRVPRLLDHLRAHGREYDLVLFWSYRYYTAFFGLPIVADRAILVPTAEEDPAIFLDVLEPFFQLPAGHLFLTPEEQAIVVRRAGRPLEPFAIAGMGLDPAPPPAANGVLERLGLRPGYLLYLGRVDRNKGCEVLFEYFLEHAAREDDDTTLVLAGPAAIPVPSHPRIRALGYVEPAVRNALLDGAGALVASSPYESLGIAVLEGWNHGVPALVNGDCRVLVGQVRRANGGLYYRSAREFSTLLSWLTSHHAEARQLGAQGRAYVDREYRWPVVLERVERLMEDVLARRRTG